MGRGTNPIVSRSLNNFLLVLFIDVSSLFDSPETHSLCRQVSLRYISVSDGISGSKECSMLSFVACLVLALSSWFSL